MKILSGTLAAIAAVMVRYGVMRATGDYDSRQTSRARLYANLAPGRQNQGL